VVTAHLASNVKGSYAASEEWRVLRFNEATRQSVARVHQEAGSIGSGWAADARCLAFEYTKTIAAAGDQHRRALCVAEVTVRVKTSIQSHGMSVVSVLNCWRSAQWMPASASASA
jgi:hypothetical protein